MSCNYCWNQPKRFGEYDLYLDGKIKANDFVYRVKNKETGKIESLSITEEFESINERLKTHFTFDTSFKSYNELETALNNGELKESAIYVIENETSSDDTDSKDNYNEYMIISVENEDGTIVKKLELIGSGNYTKQNIDILEEKNRAIERENEIEEVYSNITGYPFEKLNDSNLNIDNRIKKEIENRQVSEAAISSVLVDEIKNRKEEMKNKVTINTPITISKTNGTSTTTTSITDTSVSTTSLTGTLDAKSMKNSLTAEAVQSVVPIAFGTWSNKPTVSRGESISIGDGAISDNGGITIGAGANVTGEGGVALGNYAEATANYTTAIGGSTHANKTGATAIGYLANANDIGVVVFASNSEDFNTRTKLYFSGANTPLANEYYNGEAMMGYTVTDKDGNKLACGTRRLSELFPDNSLTQTASINENGEWVMPKVFHPSDLNLPVEEPSEPEDVKINIP